jgi:phytoene dehydrogenase-like protein
MSGVVVIGGGFGGVAAAVRLAKLGHDVTVVEALDRVGGAVGVVERDGFCWDAGPASTALPAVLRDLFRKSGRPLERELELVPVEPMREHRFLDGTVLALPSGSRSAQLEAVEGALGGGLGLQWVDYVHAYADTWDLLRRAFLERPYSAEHVDADTRALLRTRTSLHRTVHRRLKDRRLRTLAVSSTVLDGQDPRQVPAWMGMWAYVEQNFGVWTVPGGLGALGALLAKRLAERKVQVRLGTTAVDLRLHGGRVTGVHTDHGPLDADVVVCAVDPQRLPALAASLPHSATAPSPAVTHLGLSGKVPDLPLEVVLHGDPTLVVRTHGTAPSGAAAWTVLARGQPVGDVLSTLASRGIDVRGQVVVRLDRSSQDQVEELGGSPYGVLWRGRRTTDRLLAPAPLAGVHLAGVHAAVGAGLPLVGLAAAVVAQQIGPPSRGGES